MGPLSGKQQREWAKHHAKEARESAKMESEESRKQELHEIKLQEAAAKANQGIGHKEELHGLKVKELGGPLSGKKMNRQKMGLPSNNPLAGAEVFHRGQHMLPKGTDTVPAMLTPGEAVIPRAAAQDPKNKPLIKQMVQEGRAQHYAKGTTGVVQQQNLLPIIPKVMPKRNPKGYAEGTTAIPNIAADYYHTDNAVSMEDGTTQVEPRYYDDGSTGIAPYGLREMESVYDPIVPKGNGFMGAIPASDGSAMTEYTSSDEKGQYPTLVPTLTSDEIKQVQQGNLTPEIQDKAASFRDTRVNKGKSPFIEQGEMKVPPGTGDSLYQANIPETDYSERIKAAGQPAPVSVSELSPKTEVPVMQDDQYNPDVKQGATVPFPQDDQYNADVKQWAKGGAAPRSLSEDALSKDAKNAELAKELAADKELNNRLDAAVAKNDKPLVTKIFEDIYGDTGLFNRKDLVRFALLAGSSKLLGYDTARSVRFAGRDTLAHADKRAEAQEREAAQNRTFAQQDKRAMATEVFRTEQANKLAAWKDAKEDKRAQNDLFSKSKEHYDKLVTKVPEKYQGEKNKILLELNDSLADSKGDQLQQMQAYDLARFKLGFIVNDTPKGTTVHMPTPAQMTTIVDNTTGVARDAVYDPRARQWTTPDGKAIDMSRYNFKSTADAKEHQYTASVSASIPDTIKNDKGEMVKNPNKAQLEAAAKQTLFTMGMREGNPEMVGRIVSRAAQDVAATNKPMDQDNLQLAIQRQVMSVGDDSPIMQIKAKTTNNKDFKQVADVATQMRIANQVASMAKAENTTPEVLAKTIEANWKDPNKDTKLYNKFLQDAPLKESLPVEYYKFLKSQQKKDKD